jgi:two-component system, response regulator PdtaR
MTARQSRSMDVLVVEDEPLVREIAVEALWDAGLGVTEAASAEAALAIMAETGPPPVLVTDVDLGRSVMDGLVLATEVCRRWPQTAVIYITERPGALSERALGPRERYVPKPFEPARLARLVCEMSPPCPHPPRRVRGRDVVG